MSPSTFELWVERPNLPTQHSTYPNFIGQEARRLAKKMESTWDDSRRRNGSGSWRLGQLNPVLGWACQLQHRSRSPPSTAGSLYYTGTWHHSLAPLQDYSSMQPSIRAGSQLPACHNLASLGFVLADLVFLLAQRKFWIGYNWQKITDIEMPDSSDSKRPDF